MFKKDNLTVVTIDDVFQWGWDVTDLVNCLTGIDASTLGCVWTMKQWVPILESRRAIFPMLATADNNIVGYIFCFALTDSTFQTAMKGCLEDEDISISIISPMKSSGDYNLYCDTVAIMPEFQSAGSILIFVFAPQLAGIFGKADAASNIMNVRAIRFFSASFPLSLVSAVFINYYQGIKNIRMSNLICVGENLRSCHGDGVVDTLARGAASAPVFISPLFVLALEPGNACALSPNSSK